MNNSNIIRLYPASGEAVPIRGLYLRTPLHAEHRPVVYSNFVAGIDGRIALLDPAEGILKVPPQVANPRDWRLFQELAARADVLITSGRYLRELAEGRAQDVLPVSSEAAFSDLLAWRREHGLRPQPDVAVFSASLAFPVPREALQQGRRMLVFTGRDASTDAQHALQSAGAEVFRCRRAGGADAAEAIAELDRRGYRRVYSVTGPLVLHSLLEADVLDTLFVTTVHRIVGGSGSNLVEGPLLKQPVNFRLTSLYYDDAATAQAGQSFARYDR